MTSKRRPTHNQTTLNFRPNNNQSNSNNNESNSTRSQGTKPTSEPTTITETLTLMLLYLCKRSLFFNTYYKAAIYMGALFIISLIVDFVSMPKSYLSRSDNAFNKYFVKYAWAWNLLLLTPYLMCTAYVYCCGQKKTIALQHLVRIVIATIFWWSWTHFFNVIEAAFGRCVLKQYSTKVNCLREGSLWHGFDISGHSFILIYGSLVLIEEARSIENWDGIKEYLRLETYRRTIRSSESNTNPLRGVTDDQLKFLDENYRLLTPYIRAIFIVITFIQLLWDFMLLSTIIYYHIMVEKLLGGLFAILTWFLTYRVWYKHPKLWPKLPGEGGVFKYIKKKTSLDGLVKKNTTSSAPVNNRGPLFMGRPIYPQQEESAGAN